MTSAPGAIKHERLILQVFEESLAYWCAMKADIDAYSAGEKQFTNQEGVAISDVPRHIHKELLDHFERQERKIKNIASAGQFVNYQQAQYAIVALIDDQLLKADTWSEHKNWLGYLLEESLFGTRNAGFKLIQRIEDLVESDSSVHQVTSQVKQLAYVYLMVIWLGFEGKLFNNLDKLQYFKTNLIEISGLNNVELGKKHLLDQPYQHTSDDKHVENDGSRRLAPISRWHRVTMITFLMFLMVSSVIWFGFTYELSEVLEEVIRLETQ